MYYYLLLLVVQDSLTHHKCKKKEKFQLKGQFQFQIKENYKVPKIRNYNSNFETSTINFGFENSNYRLRPGKSCGSFCELSGIRVSYKKHFACLKSEISFTFLLNFFNLQINLY